MCGIAGIYNSNLKSDELNQIGKSMAKLLHHRGPDGHGIKILTSNNKNTLLTHTRLSIIDLREVSNQPMSFHDQDLWIVFNGEIYNFRTIRKELENQGIQFTTQSDTEVILAAYAMWGMAAFEKFVGMWALALWDGKNHRFVLSRDRLGKKPLFYYVKDKTVYFASEPKAILAFAPETKKLNPRAVSDYFSYRYVLGSDSFFAKIKTVPAGSHIVIENENLKILKYWDLPVVTKKHDPGEKEVRKILRDLLESAVDYRMISDVPLGAFLSGGLDSSIIVALMAKKSSKPVKTYTIGFDEEGYNEFEYANEVAKHCNTDHHEIMLSVDGYLDLLNVMIKIKDAPLAVPNEIALHQLSKILKNDISVVISGEGADELFGGYGRIFRSAFDYQRFIQFGQSAMPPELEKNLKEKYKNFKFENELDHFLGQYSYLNYKTKEELLSQEILNQLGNDPHHINYFDMYWKKLDGLELTEKYMWIFQKIHLEGLLGRLDSSTMSASVEGRSPFVDHRLIEAINQLPLHYKMRWASNEDEQKAKLLNSDQISEKFDITKYILRSEYASLLPPSISRRKKVGFPVPLGQWLSGPLRQFAKDRLLDSGAKTKNLFNRDYCEKLLTADSKNHNLGLQLWMMVNIEEWMRIYGIN